MQSAVLAMIDSVRPSDTCWYHAKTTPAAIMRSCLTTLEGWKDKLT